MARTSEYRLPPTSLYVGGAWTRPRREQTFHVVNPATRATIASVADADDADVDDIANAAYRAFQSWSQLPAARRAHFLRAMAAKMLERQHELAALMVAEQGKVLREALGEVQYAAAFYEEAASEATRVRGEILPGQRPHQRISVLRQPVGVCLAVTPWNFPLAMITRKAAPALAAGCTQIIKPAEQTPLCALALAEIAHDVELPAGVLNIVPSSQPASLIAALMKHRYIRKLSFTGSTSVGQQLMRQAADRVLRLSLELGGHAPAIVLEDADVDVAVDGIIASKFRNSGQTCICVNRVYVHASIADEFQARLVAKVEALKCGRGDAEQSDLGPLIDDDALSKAMAQVEDAQARGARIVLGGRPAKVKDCSGAFFEATVIDRVSKEMLVMREESFAPIVPICRVTSDEEAIAAANDTDVGLAAYVFGRDASRLTRVVEALEYGIVGVNDGAPSNAAAPFGGWKSSGLGREGGHYAMEEYLEWKYVSQNLLPRS